MATLVRSFSKINLGLAIGPVRGDGFHGLTTLYQTLDLFDLVTVTARLSAGSPTRISLTTNDVRVPTDGRNTVWKMVEKALERLRVAAEVDIHIEKRLPVQGGMGAGSANAVAALIGLERELGVALPGVERLKLAAEVGSDVPLFLIGGAVLGLGRGELVVPMPDLPPTWCVVAVPEIGVSTPAAFRDWDALVAGAGLTSVDNPDRLNELSLAYASLSAQSGVSPGKTGDSKSGTSGIVRDPNPEKKQGLSGESQSYALNDLAENTLLALVRTGIGNRGLHNDFEDVVFPQYPSLRITKRELMGSESGATDSPAIYAALSGSGSALFGLYRSEADAEAARRRVQASGVKAFVTSTLPREDYWTRMFAG
jgi:4-diphosphocytidyl-2-C-methyl-D-erythritol kinase